jgi:hypothetical protein
MRFLFVLLVALTMSAALVGCNSAKKWHECKPGELGAACADCGAEPVQK